jgi:hypothetical protein
LPSWIPLLPLLILTSAIPLMLFTAAITELYIEVADEEEAEIAP